MNASLLFVEFGVAGLALAILLIDLWTPEARKSQLGWIAAAGLLALFAASFFFAPARTDVAFGGMYISDGLAWFFKRLFLLSAAAVAIMTMAFSDRIRSGIAEFHVLALIALTGMLLAASANHLIMVFVSLELITLSFYVLNSFQRDRLQSLEAGIKYLILGGLSSAFLVYGIALVYSAAHTANFNGLQQFAQQSNLTGGRPLFAAGMALVLAGIGFKLAAFPFQIWAPDVYEGAPAPAAAFLAVGSKAAGVVLLLRLLFSAAPALALSWLKLLMVVSAATILYGNLCAIPQRNLKRLLGYSSIAQAGYVILGVATMNLAGSAAVLFYLSGYLFTVSAAFAVIVLAMRGLNADDISGVAGLHRRSPALAFSLALAMISLAGIPPLAGFFGKFLLLRAAVQQGAQHPGFYWLIGIAVIGVVISFYYYLGVVRAIYWDEPAETSPIAISPSMRGLLYVCIAGMVYLGVYPAAVVNWATAAAKTLRLYSGM